MNSSMPYGHSPSRNTSIIQKKKEKEEKKN